MPKDLRQKLFPTGKPAVLTEPSAAAIVQCVRTYPLRKDNKLLMSQSKGMAAQVAASTPAQAASSTDFVSVEAVCKVVEACTRRDPLREDLASARSTGSGLLQTPLLALEDGTVDGLGDPRGQKVSHAELKEKETLTVAQQVAALKKDLPKETKPEKESTPRARKGAKATAKKSAAASVGKKPAAATRNVGLKKPAAATRKVGLKRPAAAASMGREAKRQAILKLVPSALKAKYANGCAKCYHRSYCTPSCWAGRGFTLGYLDDRAGC